MCQHICHCPSSSIFLFPVYSSAVGCAESLGMKSRLISDDQLSASSAFRTWGIDAFTWLPHYARLDKQGKTNAWSPASNNRTEWLQVTCASSRSNHKNKMNALLYCICNSLGGLFKTYIPHAPLVSL